MNINVSIHNDTPVSKGEVESVYSVRTTRDQEGSVASTHSFSCTPCVGL